MKFLARLLRRKKEPVKQPYNQADFLKDYYPNKPFEVIQSEREIAEYIESTAQLEHDRDIEIEKIKEECANDSGGFDAFCVMMGTRDFYMRMPFLEIFYTSSVHPNKYDNADLNELITLRKQELAKQSKTTQ